MERSLHHPIKMIAGHAVTPLSLDSHTSACCNTFERQQPDRLPYTTVVMRLTLTLFGAASVAIPHVEMFFLRPVIHRQVLVSTKYSSCSSSSSRRRVTDVLIRRDAASQQANDEVVPATLTATAKESFLRNLERKRTGENMDSSALGADLAKLSSATAHGVKSIGPGTTVGNLESWRGRWRICHAPHIETLASLLLTSFPIVEYDFQSTDGRLVSHARYESSLFGSGWFNADGRVEVVKDESMKATSDNGNNIRRKEQVVRVSSDASDLWDYMHDHVCVGDTWRFFTRNQLPIVQSVS